MDHVKRPRDGSNADLPGYRLPADASDDFALNMFWQGWQVIACHIELYTVQSVLHHGFKRLLEGRSKEGPGEDAKVHHTAPVISASRIHSPVSTERAIATNARMAAVPSSISAPRVGALCRMVSAKPSICNL